MPRLYEYSTNKGVYILIVFRDCAQTLQVTEPAADFIDDLGYDPGDSVPRNVIKPLLIASFLCTTPNGPSTEASLAELPRLDPERCQLGESQRDRFWSFLRADAETYTAEERHQPGTLLEDESPLESLQ